MRPSPAFTKTSPRAVTSQGVASNPVSQRQHCTGSPAPGSVTGARRSGKANFISLRIHCDLIAPGRVASRFCIRPPPLRTPLRPIVRRRRLGTQELSSRLDYFSTWNLPAAILRNANKRRAQTRHGGHPSRTRKRRVAFVRTRTGSRDSCSCCARQETACVVFQRVSEARATTRS